MLQEVMYVLLLSLLVATASVDAYFDRPNMTLEARGLRKCSPKQAYKMDYDLTGVYLKDLHQWGIGGYFTIEEDLLEHLKWTYQVTVMRERAFEFVEQEESELMDLDKMCEGLVWKEIVRAGTMDSGCPSTAGKYTANPMAINFTAFYPEEMELHYGKPHLDYLRFYDSRDNSVAACLILDVIPLEQRTPEQVDEDNRRFEEESQKREEQRRKQKEEREKQEAEENE